MAKLLTDAEWQAKMDELFDLQDRWLEVFGERLSIGFAVDIGQIPLIRLCLADRDQAPLENWIQSQMNQGRKL